MIRRIVTVRKLDIAKDVEPPNINIIAAYTADVCMTDQEIKEFQDILMAEHFVEEKVDE